MSESIHVPSHTVKRWRAIFKFFAPVVLASAATAATTTAAWFKTRTSVEEIQPLIAECNVVAKEAQDQANTQRSQIYALQHTALTLAYATIELHAQAEVARAYGGSKRLPEYIERARKYYAREFERQQKEHPTELAKAVALTRLAVWRPDRDD